MRQWVLADSRSSCNCNATLTQALYVQLYVTSVGVSASKSEIVTDLDARLIQNFMDIITLKLLRNNHLTSGYDLIRHFHQRFHMLVSSGTVYSMLYSLERQGFLEGNFDGRRRVYRLTRQGEEFLKKVCLTHEHTYAVFSSIFSSAEVE
ncbi:PadR family transcriptional regulator [Candidatus Bathyarchaeota archaeon]|nr:PadR family transcriptional regulator [Candidatus Bathyarchaeota archaeon]